MEAGQYPEADEIRRLRYARMCEEKGWLLPGNISLRLERSGLINAWHVGWGFYDFEITKSGRMRLADNF